jgi:hypothetical protein
MILKAQSANRANQSGCSLGEQTDLDEQGKHLRHWRYARSCASPAFTLNHTQRCNCALSHLVPPLGELEKRLWHTQPHSGVQLRVVPINPEPRRATERDPHWRAGQEVRPMGSLEVPIMAASREIDRLPPIQGERTWPRLVSQKKYKRIKRLRQVGRRGTFVHSQNICSLFPTREWARQSPTRRMTNAQRQARFADAQKAKGLVQCKLWVTRKTCAELREAAKLTASNPDLRFVSFTMQDTKTGRMKSVKP